MHNCNNISAIWLGAHAQQQSTKTAFVYGRQSLTHGQLWHFSRSYATSLKQLGFQPRDLVLFAMDDRLEWLMLWHALILIGCIPVAIHPTIEFDRLKTICDNTKFAHALGDAELIKHTDILSQHVWENILPSADLFDDYYNYQDLDAMFMLQSSGTTSAPKLIAHRHNNLESTFLRPNPTGFTKDSVVLCAAKLGTSYGIIINAIGCLIQGMCSVIMRTPTDVRNIHRVIDKNKVTHPLLTPRLVDFVTRHRQHPFDSCIQAVYCTGEALPPTSAQAFREKFGIEVLDNYGCGEIRDWAILSNTIKHNRPGTLGRATGAGVLKLIRDDGSECAVNEVGQLIVKHPNMSLGYINDDQRNQEKFQNGWCYTGDYMSQDSDGYYTYAGRAEQLIATPQGYVSCIDLENRINQQPGVRDCVVVYDQNRLSRPLLAFVLAANQDQIDMPTYRDLLGAVFYVNKLPLTTSVKKIRELDVLRRYVISDNKNHLFV